jgi:ParB-like chromosome segregation protein Spo0J
VIEQLSVCSLKPYKRNPRTHTKKQVGQIADSIRTFGWTNPLLVDADNRVMAGHGRLKAAELLGFDCVPVIRIEDMTEAQKRAYVLADNKLAENAGWDRELLAVKRLCLNRGGRTITRS